MQPDMECTLWPDGWPTWAGGTGQEFLACCQAHDVSPLPWHAADLELAQCITGQGWPVMAGVMFIGLSTLGVVYRTVTMRKGIRDENHR